MGGIGIEEAATVGADMLDGFERGDRADRDTLLAALYRVSHYLGIEGLWRTLPNHEQRQHEADRQQHARREADELAIEIAEIGAAVLDDEGPYEGHRHDAPGRRRGEHRKGDRRHLAEIGQGRLAGIPLPIGIRDKADRRVESEHRLHSGEIQRFERWAILENEDPIDDDRRDEVRGEHVEGVGSPIHRYPSGLPPISR